MYERGRRGYLSIGSETNRWRSGRPAIPRGLIHSDIGSGRSGPKRSLREEDILGRRPIHFALYKELELVEYLCAKGADIFDLDLMERNALHFAVASGRLDVVKYTLDINPDFVHAGDCDGWTPTFWAVRECLYWDTETNQRGAIIEELIARGASITIQAQGLDRQWTAFELARYYDLSYDITKLLIPTPQAAQQSEYASAWARILSAPDSDFVVAKRYEVLQGYCDICLFVSGTPPVEGSRLRHSRG
jgi:hypothetical protein